MGFEIHLERIWIILPSEQRDCLQTAVILELLLLFIHPPFHLSQESILYIKGGGEIGSLGMLHC